MRSARMLRAMMKSLKPKSQSLVPSPRLQVSSALYAASELLATLDLRMASTPSSPASGYRGRLAPSPTGYLHVGMRAPSGRRSSGHARPRARLVMRMEDLDADRSRRILQRLRWKICAGSAFAGRRVRTRAVPTRLTWQSKRRRPLSGCVAQAAAPRLSIRMPLFTQETSIRAGRAARARASASTGSKLDILDDEPMYPGTCRHLAGHLPQLPRPTRRMLTRPRHELALPRARRRSD